MSDCKLSSVPAYVSASQSKTYIDMSNSTLYRNNESVQLKEKPVIPLFTIPVIN